MCGWSEEKNKDDFDWKIATGSTPSVKTGPAVDHTLGTTLGLFCSD